MTDQEIIEAAKRIGKPVSYVEWSTAAGPYVAKVDLMSRPPRILAQGERDDVLGLTHLRGAPGEATRTGGGE